VYCFFRHTVHLGIFVRLVQTVELLLLRRHMSCCHSCVLCWDGYTLVCLSREPEQKTNSNCGIIAAGRTQFPCTKWSDCRRRSELRSAGGVMNCRSICRQLGRRCSNAALIHAMNVVVSTNAVANDIATHGRCSSTVYEWSFLSVVPVRVVITTGPTTESFVQEITCVDES